jgi:hypothetical protein
VGLITGPLEPVSVGTEVTVSANFTDPGTLDTHNGTIDWGDGSVLPATVTETGGSGSVSGMHAYTTPGVYAVQVSVTDDDGGIGASMGIPVVIPSPVKIERASVKRDKKGRPNKDKFDFRGRLVLADFDPETEFVIVRLLGAFEEFVPPGSFVRKGKNLDKLEFKAPRGTSGIRKIEIRDDGRVRVQVKDGDIGDIDLSLPVTFSLMVGDEIFDQQVQLDEKGKFRFGPELVPALDDLIDDVLDLAPDPLTDEQVDKLVGKLETARRDLERGKAKGAVKDLEKFIEEVEKLEVEVPGFDGMDVKEDAEELIEMILDP